MHSFQESASDWTDLEYDFSSSNIVSSNTTMFVSSANNVDSKNNDVKTVLASEKSILGAPPKLDKKEIKNPRTKKSNTQKSKYKK